MLDGFRSVHVGSLRARYLDGERALSVNAGSVDREGPSNEGGEHIGETRPREREREREKEGFKEERRGAAERGSVLSDRAFYFSFYFFFFFFFSSLKRLKDPRDSGLQTSLYGLGHDGAVLSERAFLITSK